MLFLVSTSDLIQIVTASPTTVSVHASWLDYTASTVTPGNTNTTITTATTTTVVASPAAATQRNVKVLEICNTSAITANQVTIQLVNAVGTATLYTVSLPPKLTLQYTDDEGFLFPAVIPTLTPGGTWNTTSQTTTYSANPGDMVLADTSSGGFTVTLPLAASNLNSSIRVKKISSDGNNITVAAADNIDGSSTQVWSSQYSELEAISDGTTWWIA